MGLVQDARNTPLLVTGDRIIASWDTAVSARELSDYSACVVLLVSNGTAFVLDVMRERLDTRRSDARSLRLISDGATL
jgi:phage terminase large subunit-like protein